MSDVALAADVVRRTVYGYFPSRGELVRALAMQAAGEMEAMLSDAGLARTSPDEVWARFVAQVWPLAHRYRVLLALRRGDHGDEIHAALQSVDTAVASLIRRGQDDGVFGTHLPADTLARLSLATVFAIADEHAEPRHIGMGAATTATLLLLGVPAHRASELGERPEGSITS